MKPRTLADAVVLTLLLTVGACHDDPDHCSSQEDCKRSELCSLDLVCEDGEMLGTCQRRPHRCDDQEAPVCGCDGMTYQSACHAHVLGRSVASAGRCDEQPPADAAADTAVNGDSSVPEDDSGDGNAEGGADAAPDSAVMPTACGAGEDACGPGQFCNFERAVGGDGCSASPPRGTCQPLPTICPAETGPVCGCDGRVYESACDAHSRGLSVREENDCELRGCGHVVNGEIVYCDADELCLQPEPAGISFPACGITTGSHPGVCRVMPKLCSQVAGLVCGCGGYTFQNACAAHALGNTVLLDSPCEDARPACSPTLACAPGFACECRIDGSCAELSDKSCPYGPGRCVPEPAQCPTDADRVCGCDGVTYRNACEARVAGVAIWFDSPCDEKPCSSQQDCADSEVCKAEPGTPGGACSSGICVKRPETCDDTSAIVCTCDGKSMLNECVANRSGRAVAHAGRCSASPELECGGAPDVPCPAGEACVLACDAPSGATGVCRAPEACPTEQAFVCGCDGVTYLNACTATQHGKTVSKDSPCRVCTSLGDPRCIDGEVCNAATRYCEPLPDVCPEGNAPVCGCNLVTYPSACHALRAGTSIRSEGACLVVGPLRACTQEDSSACTAEEFCNDGDYAYSEICGAYQGFCELRPAGCALGPRICGWDGLQYDGACAAHLAGTAALHDRPCFVAPGACGDYYSGSYRFACDPDEFCKSSSPWCSLDTFNPEFCTKLPVGCTSESAPVCTCQGGPFLNSCVANQAGQSVRSGVPYPDATGQLVCPPLTWPWP